jgi:hypothetical protein
MNQVTRKIVSVIGVVLVIAGLDHGIFEILQGDTPTNGVLIQAIGDAHQMWFYGTEEAITLIPNFLYTGIAAVTVSIAIAVWSLWFVHTQHGATVLGLLFILLFLTGGGIAAQVVFVPFLWMTAARINRPLGGWLKRLPDSPRRFLARIWQTTLTLGSLCFLIGLFIAITGYVPGQSDPEIILTIDWALIFGGGLGFYLLTFVAGFAADIDSAANRK